MGISRHFNVLQWGTNMKNVVNVIAINVAQAQDLELKTESLGFRYQRPPIKNRTALFLTDKNQKGVAS